jgi:hypothetical protein
LKKDWLVVARAAAVVLAALPVFAADDLSAKLQTTLAGGADALQEMIAARKAGFLIADLRRSAADC